MTSNLDKFHRAQRNLAPFNVQLTQDNCEMVELQIESGEEIAKNKAEQAFEHFHRPLLVNDDVWTIPALRGFPNTNMKQCNHYLQAPDWLKLMNDVKDRRIFLTSCFAYHDGKNIHTLSITDELYFLDKAQGKHTSAPHLLVVANKGSQKSVAEEISEGKNVETNNHEFWKQLAELIKQ